MVVAGRDALGPFSDQGGAPPQSATSRPDEVPLLMGPVSPDGLQAILGTPDLSVGENRVAFVLTSTDDLVRAPEVTVSSFFFQNEDAESEPKQMAGAVFRPWPYGIRGIHTTRLAFHAPGRWGIEITVLGEDGSRKEVQLYFSVSDAPLAVAVGSPAVKSHTKTLDDVEGFSELTTGSLHDPDLYRTTVADSVTNGLPTVLVVASPSLLYQRRMRAPGRGAPGAEEQVQGPRELHTRGLLRQPRRDTGRPQPGRAFLP